MWAVHPTMYCCNTDYSSAVTVALAGSMLAITHTANLVLPARRAKLTAIKKQSQFTNNNGIHLSRQAGMKHCKKCGMKLSFTHAC